MDAIRLMDKYDTICLLSSDNDFSCLLNYLRSKKKKVILIKGGNIAHTLKNSANHIINAQDIKQYICSEKEIKKKTE